MQRCFRECFRSSATTAEDSEESGKTVQDDFARQTTVTNSNEAIKGADQAQNTDPIKDVAAGDVTEPSELVVRRRSSLNLNGAQSVLPPWAESESALADFLRAGGVDPSRFGKGSAKTLSSLLDEILQGESTLKVDAESGKVSRCVEPVFIHLRYDSKLLVLTAQIFEDGRKRTSLLRVVVEKKGPGDSGTYFCAMRGMENALCIPEEVLSQSGVLRYREDLYGFEIESFESPSYPGLRSQYLTHYVQFDILEEGLQAFHKHGLPGGTDFETCEITRRGTKVSYWTWLEVVDARKIKVTKFPPMGLELANEQACDASTLKTEQALKLLLERSGVDTSKFGVGKAKKLSALLKEVREGSCKLEINSVTGSLQRTVEPAFIQLFYHGKVLVEKRQILEDGRERTRDMVLAEKAEPLDENVAHTAFRGIEEELHIQKDALNHPDRAVFRDDAYVMMMETLDSASYPGLTCVYHTHYARVDICEGGVPFLQHCGLPGCEDFASEETTKLGTKKMYWTWMDADEARETKVKGIIQDTTNDGHQRVAWIPVGDIGSADTLEDILVKGGVVVERWGTARTKKLQALLHELEIALCTLERSGISNHVRRVVTPAFITVKQEQAQQQQQQQGEEQPFEKHVGVEGVRRSIATEERSGAFCKNLALEGNGGAGVVYRSDLNCFEAAIDDTSSFPGLPSVQRTKRVHTDACKDGK
mmetsp:Transcript_22622/g.63053  ORF Transcript_22622/g.63053 Transcript_22622/m.63053 type:complete len:704 (+) Transcript_22622:51-2162(+)